MATHNAETIFEEFRRIKDGSNTRTAEDRLLEYCRDILSDVERFHFDYKTKANSQTPQLEDSDKKNLAKAVSGFANSGGGVLLWGIKPPQLYPIAQIQTFLKNLLERSPLVTDPTVPQIDGEWLPSKDNPDAGFAALLIPESSLPPHRVTLKIKDVQHHYYFRSGSDFVVASHTQLEDMFGRRPRPHLVAVRENFACDPNTLTPVWVVAFDVENQGRGTAKQVYIEFPLVPGMNSRAQFSASWRSQAGTRDAKTGRASLVFEFAPTRVIYPGMAVRFDALSLRHSEFVSGESVRLACTLYCDGGAPAHTKIEGIL